MIVIGVVGVPLVGSKRCVRRSPGGGRFCCSEVAALAVQGLITSEGQQVWLCWDLEPAADVLLWMLPAGMEGGGGGESPLKPL